VIALSTDDIPCATCGGTTGRQLYLKHGHRVIRCTSCGLVYVSPRAPQEAIWRRYSPTYFWDEYLPSLGVIGGRFELDQFDHRHAAMLRHIEAFEQPPGRLFEVGVGAGFFLKAAARRGWTTSGVELSPEAAGFAREKLGLDIAEGAAEAMNVPDGSVDVVAMFETIEHLLDPGAVMARLHRALKPNGLLVLSTPNFNALSRLALGERWAVISPLEHLYYFTEGTLGDFLRASGFTSVAFVRDFRNWGPVETMNYHYTHSPEGRRARLYGRFVERAGRRVFRQVQRRGWADTLLCFARA
jgi:SAM-dependent methyltransferase